MKKWWLAIVLVLGMAGWWWMRGPVKGKIVQKEPEARRNEDVMWVKYGKNSKFKFEYPTNLQAGEESENRVMMVGRSGRSEQLVVVYREWKESLSELPDVQMRERKPDVYEKINVIEDWECYSKIEGWERACLKKVEDGVISVAMTANSNDGELGGEFERIVKSVE